jgi:peptide/nickel transport system ATP-binding protein
MEPLENHSTIKTKADKLDRINELLIQVGLKPYHFNRFPHEFSGGQRQRICIARALLLEPRVIICDEAVSALDVSVQAQVLNLLNELKYEYGLSYIFISHDLNVVRYMSDRIMVLENGKILEEAESDRLITDPQQAYTKALVSATRNRIVALSE